MAMGTLPPGFGVPCGQMQLPPPPSGGLTTLPGGLPPVLGQVGQPPPPPQQLAYPPPQQLPQAPQLLGSIPPLSGVPPLAVPQPPFSGPGVAPLGLSGLAAPTGGAMPNFPGLLPPQASAPGGLQAPPRGIPGIPPLIPGSMPSSNPALAALALSQERGAASASSVAPRRDPPSSDRDSSKRSKPAAETLQKQEEREQAELRGKKEEVEKLKCHLHKKANSKCKFCQRHKEAMESLQGKTSQTSRDDKKPGDKAGQRRRPDRAISEEPEDRRRGPLPLVNSKTYGFSGLLQTHIVECAHHKSLLTLETFEQVVDEMYQYANSIEPYMANSATLPCALFCCLHRLFTMSLDSRQVRRLVESMDSPYIRCCGFLYVRYGLAPDQLWNWLGEFVLDEEEFKPNPESEFHTTIGEYVEALLSHEKYYSTVLPRLPMATKRQLEEKLAPVAQFRKRTKANREAIDEFRQSGTKVEACVGIDDWLDGRVIEVLDEIPTRIRIAVRLEDSTEELVDLGKVILKSADGRPPRARPSSQQSGRGRSRSRSPRVDWSREKGRTTKELVDELRSRDREKAVCSSGKDYARKPVGYKAACALPRDQGQASYRLMEEETFVPMRRQKQRTPSPQRDGMGNKRLSAEHQARMQAVFEKYSTSKGQEEKTGRRDEVDQEEFLRLG